MKKHIVIFSHGFGVEKTDRGLFTDIASALPNIETMLFDYNEVDETTGNITVRPFSVQAKMLMEVIDRTRKAHPEAVIDLVAHSQGCRVAALVSSREIRKTILFSAPTDAGTLRMVNRYRDNPATVFDFDGVSQIPRTDGTTTFIPAEYFKERNEEAPAIELYNRLADVTELVIIKGLQDTVLGTTSFEGLNPKARLIEIEGDHDFTGSDREGMLEVVKKEIEINSNI